MKKTFLLVAVLMIAALLPAATATVTAPAGGETLDRGAAYTIRWTHSTDLTAANLVRLILFRDVAKIGEIVVNVPVTQKQYAWKVGDFFGGTAPAGANYKIRVKAMDGAYSGDSAPFTIQGGSGLVVGPGAGGNPAGAVNAEIKFTMPYLESYHVGNQVHFTWSCKGPVTDKVQIGLHWEQQMEVIHVGRNLPNNGSFTWTIPASVPHQNGSRLFHFSIQTNNQITHKAVQNKSGRFHVYPADPQIQYVTVSAQTMNADKEFYWTEDEEAFTSDPQEFPNPGPGKARYGYTHKFGIWSDIKYHIFHLYRSWVFFDLGSLPAGKTPVSCQLTSTHGAGGGHTAGSCFDTRWYVLTGPFNGDPLSLFDTQAYNPQKINTNDGAFILALLNQWRQNPGANYGLMVVGCEEGATTRPPTTEYCVVNLENITLRVEYRD